MTANLSIGGSMGTPPETPLTLLLFCKSLKIDDQRSPEKREDHTNQRLLRKKCVGAVCGNDNVLAKSKSIMVVIMHSGGTSMN